MDMSALRSSFFLLFCLLLPVLAFSQSREELEEKRKEVEQEIAYTKKLIEEASAQQRQTVNHLKMLERQIDKREELIGTMESEVQVLNEHISENHSVAEALENDLLALKEEYGRMLVFAWKNRTGYDEMVFIFSAPTFNTAWQRLKFLQYYADFRKSQIEMIASTQDMLEEKLEDLEEQVNEKANLLEEQEKEVQELQGDQTQKTKLVTSLKSKERELRRQLAADEAAAKKLDQAIKDIIRKELEAERKRNEASGKSAYAMTPEAAQLAADFTSNKAQLPWPVERGIISETFGTHAHPTLHGVKINNNGVNIRTEKGSLARAVYAGEVFKIITIPGSGNAVMVRHGTYWTVYSKLDEVVVTPGQKVNVKDPIGKISTNPKTGATELHFEIWQNFDKMNPQDWLHK